MYSTRIVYYSRIVETEQMYYSFMKAVATCIVLEYYIVEYSRIVETEQTYYSFMGRQIKPHSNITTADVKAY
jgi:hypothetical protein